MITRKEVEESAVRIESYIRRTPVMNLEAGALLIHPYDHPHTVAGAATLGMELMGQAPKLDTILVAAGGSVSSLRPCSGQNNGEPRSDDRWIARGVNSPSAVIRGRCLGGLREGGWLAYGHWLMRVSHDGRRPSVTPDLASDFS